MYTSDFIAKKFQNWNWNKILRIILVIPLSFAVLYFVILGLIYGLQTESDKTAIRSLMTLFVSVISLGTLILNTLTDDSNKIQATKNEYEIQRIRDSIDLFYMPLLNLITIDEENVTYKDRVRIINEVKGHKHLVEPVELGVPSLLPILDKYLKTKAESRVVSGELLKLVNRDLESLQKKYTKLRNEIMIKK